MGGVSDVTKLSKGKSVHSVVIFAAPPGSYFQPYKTRGRTHKNFLREPTGGGGEERG